MGHICPIGRSGVNSGQAPGSMTRPNPSCSKHVDTILYYYFHIKEEHCNMY